MNPCPCGYLGHPSNKCHCTSDAVLRYQDRISGPLLDRIDIQIEVPAMAPSDAVARKPTASRARVIAGACGACASIFSWRGRARPTSA